MAKNGTLQLYRGTKLQNDGYKGAAGELTADMDSKQLRLHDGTTTGGSVIGGGGDGGSWPMLEPILLRTTPRPIDLVGRVIEGTTISSAIYPDAVAYLEADYHAGTAGSETFDDVVYNFIQGPSGKRYYSPADYVAIYNVNGNIDEVQRYARIDADTYNLPRVDWSKKRYPVKIGKTDIGEYCIHSDGWVVQSARYVGTMVDRMSIPLLLEMATIEYLLSVTVYNSDTSSAAGGAPQYITKTTTSFSGNFHIENGSNKSQASGIDWAVEGYAAASELGDIVMPHYYYQLATGIDDPVILTAAGVLAELSALNPANWTPQDFAYVRHNAMSFDWDGRIELMTPGSAATPASITCPSDGAILYGGTDQENYTTALKNGVRVGIIGGSQYSAGSAYFDVVKDDVITWSGNFSSNGGGFAYFIPYKNQGSNGAMFGLNFRGRVTDASLLPEPTRNAWAIVAADANPGTTQTRYDVGSDDGGATWAWKMGAVITKSGSPEIVYDITSADGNEAIILWSNNRIEYYKYLTTVTTSISFPILFKDNSYKIITEMTSGDDSHSATRYIKSEIKTTSNISGLKFYYLKQSTQSIGNGWEANSGAYFRGIAGNNDSGQTPIQQAQALLDSGWTNNM
jgi:hypothetical protein